MSKGHQAKGPPSRTGVAGAREPESGLGQGVAASPHTGDLSPSLLLLLPSGACTVGPSGPTPRGAQEDSGGTGGERGEEGDRLRRRPWEAELRPCSCQPGGTGLAGHRAP